MLEVWYEISNELGKTSEINKYKCFIILGPVLDRVHATKEASFYSDSLFVLKNDQGVLQESYFTYSVSPIYTEKNDVGGLLIICFETTKSLINARQLKVLR